MYGDLVHSAGNLESFLSSVSQLPHATQNHLLQEKITLLHDKLAYTLDELKTITESHESLRRLLTDL